MTHTKKNEMVSLQQNIPPTKTKHIIHTTKAETNQHLRGLGSCEALELLSPVDIPLVRSKVGKPFPMDTGALPIPPAMGVEKELDE